MKNLSEKDYRNKIKRQQKVPFKRQLEQTYYESSELIKFFEFINIQYLAWLSDTEIPEQVINNLYQKLSAKIKSLTEIRRNILLCKDVELIELKDFILFIKEKMTFNDIEYVEKELRRLTLKNEDELANIKKKQKKDLIKIENEKLETETMLSEYAPKFWSDMYNDFEISHGVYGRYMNDFSIWKSLFKLNSDYFDLEQINKVLSNTELEISNINLARFHTVGMLKELKSLKLNNVCVDIEFYKRFFKHYQEENIPHKDIDNIDYFIDRFPTRKISLTSGYNDYYLGQMHNETLWHNGKFFIHVGFIRYLSNLKDLTFENMSIYGLSSLPVHNLEKLTFINCDYYYDINHCIPKLVEKNPKIKMKII